MELMGINLVAVIVATVAAFAFGAAYYTLLGKQWLDAVGLTEEDAQQRSATPFVVSAVGLLVMACVLAGHFADHLPETITAWHAVESAVVLWLGLIVTTTATNNIFRGGKIKLTVLDSGHWLGVLVIESLVISAF